MNFSVPLNLNLNNLFQHWWTLCRRESLDSLSRANLDLLACSLHLNQSQLCSAWSSQIIAGIGRVIRRLQSFQARERSVPARGRVLGTSAACLSTVSSQELKRITKSQQEWLPGGKKAGAGQRSRLEQSKRENSEARTLVTQANNSLSTNGNSPEPENTCLPQLWPFSTSRKFVTVPIASQENPCRVKYIYQLLWWTVLFLRLCFNLNWKKCDSGALYFSQVPLPYWGHKGYQDSWGETKSLHR